MKSIRIFLLALLLGASPALAQVNPGTSPLSIAKGGTAAATASAARTSLGLAIGTNVEAWSTNLDCLAALASNGVIQRTGSGTCAALTSTQLTALLNLATASLPGALPAWPNNTTTFFRGDGTYASVGVPGGGTGLNSLTIGYLPCGAGTSAFGTVATSGGSSGLPLISQGTACPNYAQLSLAAIAAGTQDTVLGYFGSTSVSAAALVNCPNAMTYLTATHSFGCNTTAGTGTVTTAGTGLSLSGGGSTLNLALTNATLQASPGNPTATTSTTGVMMGLGTSCHITPIYSTRVKLEFFGNMTNSSNGNTSSTLAKFGTGTAPANGVAVTGTTVGTTIAGTPGVSGANYPFATGGIITGLTPGTAYWFDLDSFASAGTNTQSNISCNVMEF